MLYQAKLHKSWVGSLKEASLRKAAAVKGAMQDSLDTGQPMSEDVVSVEIDKQVVSMQVSLVEIEVSGEVILCYISPSQPEVSTKKPMRNPDGTRIPAAFE